MKRLLSQPQFAAKEGVGTLQIKRCSHHLPLGLAICSHSHDHPLGHGLPQQVEELAVQVGLTPLLVCRQQGRLRNKGFA